MPEPASRPAPAADAPGAGEQDSHALSARAAGLALRLADLVEARASAESGAEAAAAFLRDWAGSARPGPGQPSDPLAAAPGHPLAALASRLRLTGVEVDLLLLAGLPEEHEGLASTLRNLHPRGEPAPSVGLAALVVEADLPDRAVLRRLLHEGRAARSGLLVVTGEGSFFERSLVVAEEVWGALHGHDAWPRSLRRVEVAAPPAGLGGWLELPAVQRARGALDDGLDCLLLIASGDDAVAVSRCATLAAAAATVAVAARLRPEDTGAVALLALHAAARGGVPVVVAPDPAEGVARQAPDLGRVAGPVLVCATPGSVQSPADRAVLAVPLGPIGTADRRAAWRAALSESAGEAAALAARHPLDPAITAQVALDLDGRERLAGGRLDLSEVAATIRARAGIALPPGVDLLTPRAGWEQLVLDPGPSAQLREAVDRLEHQSLVLDDWDLYRLARADRGVRLLFTGPPGTGKSLAAEVVAAAAATDLLVVDVSQVVSKWLGETEKNLAAIFDVAERTQAVLFLDEADALFATRTEIADAHDRYANLETAWLLQRLDRFDGLAVLATNLRRNIDAAFVRRMDFVVEFTLPGEADRLEIWARHLPARLRGDDVDLAQLARLYPVPGGWIRNAAIAAAFLAAAGDELVRQEHLVAAMRREYGKASKPFPGAPPRRGGPDHDERAARLLAATAAASGRTEAPR
jgi:ATPase family associated with various cellular activities (AAA)